MDATSDPHDWSAAVERNRRTVAGYEDYARTYASIVDRDPLPETQEGLRRLHDLVPAGGLVLEVGSGAGHDADFLEALGTTVRRTDITRAFIDIQAERGKTAELLNVMTDDLGGPYDGVLALCVLIHVAHEQLPAVLDKVSASLRPGGVALLMMREGEGAEEHDEWFTALWRQDALEKAYAAAGLDTVWHVAHTTADGERWLTHVLRRTV